MRPADKLKLMRLLCRRKELEMKTIYVVTQGSYSDYHICAVFDTKELAEQYCSAFGKAQRFDTMGIEEWGLNPYKIELGKGYKPFFVRMDKEGNTSEVYEDDSSYGYTNDVGYGFDIRDNMYNHCFAKSTDHAIKITNEKRVQMLAENKWGRSA